VKAGESILTQGNLYGGSDELLSKILSPFGIQPVFIALKDLNLAEDHLKRDETIKMIYVETPSNPTIDVYDIGGLAALAKKYDKLIAVDNTFATPYLQQPFQFDVDFVVHSTTKYLNGHGNSTSGVLISKHLDLMDRKMLQYGKLLGANSNAFDAWLLLQGVKTLEVRMQRHCSNAMQIATFLEKNDKVNRVNYAGLPKHSDHEVAKKQMRDFSGMLSFELAGGLEAGKNLLKHTRVCRLAVSLGTVDTIIQHPASMSHVGVAKEQREKYGITDGLIRLSVGIEDVNDLLEDLEEALEKV
jgi:methionine-gamma-lyase